METFQFEKTFLDRLDETMSVLTWDHGVLPVSQIRKQWSYFIELQIESTGWAALWKIPRHVCDELHLRFPTIVYGCVDQVFFRELKASFIVLSVQDDEIHLPEKNEVALEDLWPTFKQEIESVNAERTAECIDRLRFFYNHIWMPWDRDLDDDYNWVDHHLHSRIRFYYDLCANRINMSTTSYIRNLLDEANYLGKRREYLELGFSDDEEADGQNNTAHIKELMHINLRLSIIRAEVDILENSELRDVYEETILKHKLSITSMENNLKCTYYFISGPNYLEEQIRLLETIKNYTPKSFIIQICDSLQAALDFNGCKIWISPGLHEIHMLNRVCENGFMFGLENKDKHKAIIKSSKDNYSLIIFNSHFMLQELSLDCSNVHTGIIIKNCQLKIKKCHLIGGGQSTQHGIYVTETAQLIIEDCTFENFGTGILCNNETTLKIKNTQFLNCHTGLSLSTNNCVVNLEDVSIKKSVHYGIIVKSMDLLGSESVVFSNLSQLSIFESGNFLCTGHCSFAECAVNIKVLNRDNFTLRRRFSISLLDTNTNDDTTSVCSLTHEPNQNES